MRWIRSRRRVFAEGGGQSFGLGGNHQLPAWNPVVYMIIRSNRSVSPVYHYFQGDQNFGNIKLFPRRSNFIFTVDFELHVIDFTSCELENDFVDGPLWFREFALKDLEDLAKCQEVQIPGIEFLSAGNDVPRLYTDDGWRQWTSGAWSLCSFWARLVWQIHCFRLIMFK